jgi:putative alpha-1,2-mannosidase
MVKKKYGFRSKFSHEYEKFEPGYYEVLLEKYNILVELTATDHSAIHNYKFREINKRNTLIFDTSYTLDPTACANSSTTIDPITKVNK